MFGTNILGTRRFGESQSAVSPVLLSAVAAQTSEMTQANALVARAAGTRTLATTFTQTSITRLALVVVATRQWVECTNPVLLVRRTLNGTGTSQSRTSGNVLRAQNLKTLCGSSTSTTQRTHVCRPVQGFFLTTDDCGGTLRVLNQLQVRTQSDGFNTVAPQRVGRLTTSTLNTARTESRVRTSMLLSGIGIDVFTCSNSISVPGLIAWSVATTAGQVDSFRTTSLLRSRTDERLTDRNALRVQTSMRGRAQERSQSEGQIVTGRFGVFVVQGSSESGTMSIQRRTGTTSAELNIMRRASLDPTRTLSSTHQSIIWNTVGRTGTALILAAVQDTHYRATAQATRSIAGASQDTVRTSNRLLRIRELHTIEKITVSSTLTVEPERSLQAVVIAFGSTANKVGRVRALRGWNVELVEEFGRFAVVPDVSNDRLVVVYAEGRLVVVPRQAEV